MLIHPEASDTIVGRIAVESFATENLKRLAAVERRSFRYPTIDSVIGKVGPDLLAAFVPQRTLCGTPETRLLGRSDDASGSNEIMHRKE
jgi:hypothetical protein